MIFLSFLSNSDFSRLIHMLIRPDSLIDSYTLPKINIISNSTLSNNKSANVLSTPDINNK
jgi:hypothetical protein